MDTTSMILDPELGSTSFTVERITCSWTRSGTGVHIRTARLPAVANGSPALGYRRIV